MPYSVRLKHQPLTPNANEPDNQTGSHHQPAQVDPFDGFPRFFGEIRPYGGNLALLDKDVGLLIKAVGRINDATVL